jgi:hypothetical protein
MIWPGLSAAARVATTVVSVPLRAAVRAVVRAATVLATVLAAMVQAAALLAISGLAAVAPAVARPLAPSIRRRLRSGARRRGGRAARGADGLLRIVPRPDRWLPRPDLRRPRRDLRLSRLVRSRPEAPAAQAGPASAPAMTEASPRSGPRPAAWPVRLAASAGWLLLGLALYTCYLHLSRTAPTNSDGASNALQAWAMWHGNPLLRGWVLSDVSFYTTELPQYLLIELVRGLTPDVSHIAAAMTYTLLVLLAGRLAKGSATGTGGLLRVAIAVGIMLAPQQSSLYVLMLEPDHVGSALPVLMLLLLVDRAGRKWYVPPLACLLLTWGLIADQVILITAVCPLLLVALIRAYHLVIRQRRKVRTAWFELCLAVAAMAGVVTATRTLGLIKAAGGFTVWPVDNTLAPFSELPHDLLQLLLGILILFGANFTGQKVGFGSGLALLHLIDAGLVVWAVGIAGRRFTRRPLAVQLLAAAITLSVLAYLLGPAAGQANSSREFAAVLPLGAALAGRVLAGRLRRARLVPATAAVLAVYLAGLVMVADQPPAPAQNQALASWLASHRLDYGLADYWLANSVTVDSGGRVAVRAIRAGDRIWPYFWESQPSWYDPQLHVADFVVLPSYGPGPWTMAPSAARMLAAFGQPARVYFLADYTVLVWNTNLLAKLA